MYDDQLEAVVAATGARVVTPEAIYAVDADVFAPCALGAVINDETVARISAPIVAGAANNQLATPRHGDVLHRRNVLYAPDYVINAGGVIDVEHERLGYNPARVKAHVERIGATLENLFERSRRTSTPTHVLADTMAREIIASAAKLAA